MTRYLLTVTVPPRVFDAYWYGIGEIVSQTPTADSLAETHVVDYGADRYRAQYQADRFASGLYFATVTEV